MLTAMSSPLPRIRLDLREASGAVADLGVLVPIAVALVVVNGLSPTAVLLPAALLYLFSGWYYRVPVPVQPLKAFGALAIAHGLGGDAIAAGALIMAVLFAALSLSGLVDRVTALVPLAVVRGVQLSVGLIFVRLAWGMVTHPPRGFAASMPDLSAGLLAGALAVLMLVGRRHHVTLAVVVAGVAWMVVRGDLGALGPSALHAPDLSWSVLVTAATVLVLPQVPLTFANSCVATQDVAHRYYGDAARRVRSGRLALSLAAGNVVAAGISGMPVCHGAGGMTAHRAFGARSGGAPLIVGAGLLTAAVGFGASLAGLLGHFPVVVLAALLAVAGGLHVALVRDVRGWRAWLVTGVVGAAGVAGQLGLGLLVGWALDWALRRR